MVDRAEVAATQVLAGLVRNGARELHERQQPAGHRLIPNFSEPFRRHAGAGGGRHRPSLPPPQQARRRALRSPSSIEEKVAVYQGKTANRANSLPYIAITANRIEALRHYQRVLRL